MDELNRDLLVAVLAVLTDAIPRDSLAAILKAWSRQRQTPLAQVIKQVSGLDGEKYRELESLASVHLNAHWNDIRQSLNSLRCPCPDDRSAHRDRRRRSADDIEQDAGVRRDPAD